MIQDIAPRKLNNHYSSKTVKDDSLIIVYKDGKFLLKYDESGKNVTYPAKKLFGDGFEYKYLFSIDEEDFFYADGNQITGYPPEFDYYDMKFLRKEYIYPKHYIYAALTAYHLIEWYTANRFCGRCGAENVDSERERARVCPKCGATVYPRINPAVIVGVTNGDRLLLTKYRTGFAHNALVAGFTEIGETLEETVAREVMEETGIHVKNIRYYKSQPWGIASDILVGFYCDVDGDDTITMDESELKYAEWVPRQEIELQPLEYSLTNEMMKMFKEGKE